MDIDDAQERVAGRFDQYQARLALHGRRHGGRVVLIHEQQIELALGRTQAQQLVCAAIAIVRREDEIAWFASRQDEVDGGHAAANHRGAGAAFQFGQGLGQHVARGIAGPGIVVSARPLEAGEGVARRQVNRGAMAPNPPLADAVYSRDGLRRSRFAHVAAP